MQTEALSDSAAHYRPFEESDSRVEVLGLWREKLEFLEIKYAMLHGTNPALEFQLTKQIAEAKRKICDLSESLDSVAV